jgi:lysophospholipase L1-like esterase
VVVLGHSGSTGYNTDPADGSRDVKENSWATGTNPAVDSVYRRLAARSPEYEGHTANLAEDGATVQNLLQQAHDVAGIRPAPGVVFVEIVDNDIRCDGTDAQNYAPFARTLTTALRTISTSAPDARIYVTSLWGTTQSYARAIAPIPAARRENTGTGPCDLFDSAGRARTPALAYLQDVVEHYQQQLAGVCRTVPNCHYDNGALQAFSITAADLTPDHNHLSISGHKKYADLVWKTFFA